MSRFLAGIVLGAGWLVSSGMTAGGEHPSISDEPWPILGAHVHLAGVRAAASAGRQPVLHRDALGACVPLDHCWPEEVAYEASYFLFLEAEWTLGYAYQTYFSCVDNAEANNQDPEEWCDDEAQFLQDAAGAWAAAYVNLLFWQEALADCERDHFDHNDNSGAAKLNSSDGP